MLALATDCECSTVSDVLQACAEYELCSKAPISPTGSSLILRPLFKSYKYKCSTTMGMP